jgi:preprotein translocase subunit SecD
VRSPTLLALVATAACVGGCSRGKRAPVAEPPKADQSKADPARADPSKVVGIRRLYALDFAQAWEAGLDREQMLARAEESVRRRVDEVMDGGVVRRTAAGVEVFLPDAPAEKLEACRRIVPRPGRFQIRVVDDGSAFMTKLARRLRGSADDVTADEERWFGPADDEHRSFYFAAKDRGRLLTLVDQRLAETPPPPDRRIVLENVDGRWRTHYVIEGGGVDNADIAEARAAPGFDGKPELVIDLTPEGRRKNTDMTTRALGRKLVIVVDGTVMTAPVVMTPISGETQRITSASASGDPAAAGREMGDLAANLRSGPLPAPLAVTVEERWPRGGPSP